MPWVDSNECVGCEICVKKCPVNAISMEEKKAKIDMNECIRCGVCHQICPQEAVRHDSEKIPEEVKENVRKTKKFMELCLKHFGDQKEANKCLDRMVKYFNKERLVAERTLEEIETLKGG